MYDVETVICRAFFNGITMVNLLRFNGESGYINFYLFLHFFKIKRVTYLLNKLPYLLNILYLGEK